MGKRRTPSRTKPGSSAVPQPNTSSGFAQLPSTPGAGQNQQALRWNNGGSAFEFFTPGGGTATGRCALVTGDGIPSVPSVYELHTPAEGRAGGRYLRLKFSADFPYAQADYIASVEAGWTWQNSGALDSADANTTTSNALRADHDNTSTNWTGAVQQGPLLYRTAYITPSGTQELIARISCNADANVETAGIMIARDAAPGTYGRIGSAWNSSQKIISNASGSLLSSTALTTGQRDAGVWYRLVVYPDGNVGYYYDTTNQAAPPSTWTLLNTHATFTGTPDSLVRYGFFMITVNTSDTLTADLLYIDDRGMRPHNVFATSFSPAGGGGYDDANTEIELVSDWDLGSDAPDINDTALDNMLQDAVNRLPGDAATWTFFSIQSASTGAVSGTYQSLGSISTSGTGRYWSLFAKCNSDGAQPGSIRLPLVVPVA